MAYWRHIHWYKFVRLLLLLVILGQTALLLHESGHSGLSGESECQLCLHAQPQVTVTKSSALPINQFERIALISTRLELPPYFSPVYSNSSRGPPGV